MKLKLWSGLFLGFCCLSESVWASDKLVIISPHRKSIQQEFIPSFEKYYEKTYKTQVTVEWLDQGGTSDDVRFIKARFAANPATAGIDVFWGGGTAVYMDLDTTGILAPYTPPSQLGKQLPNEASSVPLVSPKGTWRSSAMSSFGVFY